MLSAIVVPSLGFRQLVVLHRILDRLHFRRLHAQQPRQPIDHAELVHLLQALPDAGDRAAVADAHRHPIGHAAEVGRLLGDFQPGRLLAFDEHRVDRAVAVVPAKLAGKPSCTGRTPSSYDDFTANTVAPNTCSCATFGSGAVCGTKMNAGRPASAACPARLLAALPVDAQAIVFAPTCSA